MKKIIIAWSIIFASLYSWCAFAINVADVQKAIQEKGEQWQAGETSVSKMTPEQQKKLGGALPEPESVLQRIAKIGAKEQPKETRALPATWDWRNKDGQNWVSPIRDQNPHGTCAAFASIACVESLMKIQTGNPSLDLDLSERFLFTYGGGDAVKGWWASQAGDFLMTVGTVPESNYLYSTWTGTMPSESPANYIANNNTFLVEGWAAVAVPGSPATEAQIKTAVMDGPIMAWIDIYEDLTTYSSGVYSHTTGAYLGAHYVALIGWDDAGDYWICKNSWGTWWGESGYLRIKKSNGGASSFCQYSYKLLPRTSGAMMYFHGQEGASTIPDGTSQLMDSTVARGFAQPQDITIGFRAIHPRLTDLKFWLQNPVGGSILFLDKKGGTYPNFEGLFLNDKCVWSISDLISMRQMSGVNFGSYRGCAYPDNAILPLIGNSGGSWSIKVQDDVAGQSGSLSWWGVYLGAEPATNVPASNWNRY